MGDMELKEHKEKEVDEDNQAKIETFDDILPYIGEAGRYQWFLFLILLPFTIIYAVLYFVQFFLTLVPEEHWCTVPEFEDMNLTDWQKIELSVPLKSQIGDDDESYVPYSRCKMYLVNYTEVLMTGQKPGPDTPVGSCQYGWSFNLTTIPYRSLGAELEWVCSKSHLASTAQSIFFIGSIVGGFIFGYIADHYGRRPALIACNLVGFVASIGTAFCNSYWSFVLVRFIAGTAFDNCFNIVFIIVMEYVGPKLRTIMLNMSLGIYFAFAASSIPWIAYWISNWKILAIVTALPLTVTFVTPWIVPESARWYIQNDRIDDAMKVIKRLAKINRKTIPKEVYVEFEKSCKNMNDEPSHNSGTVLDLFKLPRLRRLTLVLIFNWLMIVFTFDGHIWNMKSLHPNVFISFSLASISELPAAIVVNFLLDRWGRRWMGFLSMFICGVFSFIALAMPIGASAMWMAAIARLGVNVAINIAFQQSTELLPTVVRVQGISLIHVIGYVAHFFGPSVFYMSTVKPWLPLVVLGSLSFITAFLTLTLPETMDQQMPDTLEEGNNFGKDQNFWWVPCTNMKMYKTVKKTEN